MQGLLLLFSLSYARVLTHQWVSLDFDWESEQQKQQYIDEGKYVVENCALTGVKTWKGETYVTVPRWRTGVPSTLNKVVEKNNETILQPFPSWEMQNPESPDGLKYVQSMEIDSRGWMWILDVGRQNILEAAPIDGPAKLIIWDITNDCMISKYEFPHEVFAFNFSFANDIVVDQERGWAYMSDTWGKGGIVIYNLQKNEAVRFTHPTMAGNDSLVVRIDGIVYDTIHSPSDGIALDSRGEILFYSTVSTHGLYSIPTDALHKYFETKQDISNEVVLIGNKHGFSDGLVCDKDGALYYGDFENSLLWKWDIGTPLSSAATIAGGTPWPDTFAWDEQNLIFTTNNLEKYFAKTMKFDGSTGPNFRIWKLETQSLSYLQGMVPNPSSLPCSDDK